MTRAADGVRTAGLTWRTATVTIIPEIPDNTGTTAALRRRTAKQCPWIVAVAANAIDAPALTAIGSTAAGVTNIAADRADRILADVRPELFRVKAAIVAAGAGLSQRTAAGANTVPAVT